MQHTLTLKTDHVAYAHCCSLMARAAARRAAARAAARATAARAAAGRPAASRLVAQTTARGRRLEPRWATARQADAPRTTARAAARATTGRRCDRRRFDAVEPVARHEALLSVRAWVGGAVRALLVAPVLGGEVDVDMPPWGDTPGS